MRIKIWQKIITVFILIAHTTVSFAAVSSDTSLCIARGYTVGFFNGVWNTPSQAAAGAAAMARMMGHGFQNASNIFKGEPVQYEVFYNVTGCKSGTGAICVKLEDNVFSLEDVAESFIQRANEIDARRDLAKRGELVFEIISGDTALLDKLSHLYPALQNWKEQLITELKAKAAGTVANLASNPPTQADYVKHNTRLDALALQKQKLMLVAHSQGNLFVNQAYKYISPKIGSSSVAVVHIAPASTETHGKAWLASIDTVINVALRAAAPGNIVPVNAELTVDKFPFSSVDRSGHELVKTYLDVSRVARALIKDSITAAMNNLQTPTLQGNIGSFTITLTWDGAGDVDLHTFEPNNQHVYYSSRQGVVGYLDVDNTIAKGPEHYFASCDPNILQPGLYKVGLNNYSGATGRTATVQVATSVGGVVYERSLGVGAVRGSSGNSSPLPVVNVKVAKDTTGKFIFSVQ